MTKKLYDIDSHIKEFEAQVISCKEENGRYAVLLDRTAFFPEGGGQASDNGKLDIANVLDVQEKSGQIIHYTDLPLKEGGTFTGILD
ncbi:MAG: alanine--tRNA ligase-related protein, partial [Acutalibacteraceae bacterium]